MMKAYRSILIVKMSSLGDVLHALPTLYALRENNPHARIVWAVHENFSAVLPGKPYIDDVIYIDKKKLKKSRIFGHCGKSCMRINLTCVLICRALQKCNRRLVEWRQGKIWVLGNAGR